MAIGDQGQYVGSNNSGYTGAGAYMPAPPPCYPPTPVEKNSELNQTITNLRTTINETDILLNTLVQRLLPVLSQKDAKTNGSSSPVIAVTADATLSIYTESTRIANYNELIRQLLDRLVV